MESVFESFSTIEIESVGDLREYLYENQQQSAFDNTLLDFWPRGLVNSLGNQDVIRRVLSSCREPYQDDLVEFISAEAARLFTITATVLEGKNLTKALQVFHSARFGDENLEAEIDNSNGAADDTSYLKDVLINLSKDVWKPYRAFEFTKNIWPASVPVLSTEDEECCFHRRAILPFITEDTIDSQGAFSIVHKVSIHPDHYEDSFPKVKWPNHFAVKKIRPPNDDEKKRIADRSKNEAKLLRKMNALCEKNTIRFITAFQRREANAGLSYYLMFEWADGGSLEDLWKENKVYPSADVVRDAIDQVLGLAEALVATHAAGNRHGDLKPANILHFKDKENPKRIFGTLKIGDWGLARYHNLATIYREQQEQGTTTNYGTPLYEAPEADKRLAKAKKILSRQYDVWSMGCIILELIIWLIYGYENVQRFRKDVKGTSKIPVPCYKVVSDINGNKGELRDGVIKWLNHLTIDPVCAEDTALGELLKLVKERLLIVDLPPLRAQTGTQDDFNQFGLESLSSLQLPQAILTPPSPSGQILPQIAPTIQDSPGLIPQITVTSDSISEDPLAETRYRVQDYRATSTELVDHLNRQILDDSGDHSDDFWFREAAILSKNHCPPEVIQNQNQNQDESGHLSASGMSSRESMTESASDSAVSSSTVHLGVRADVVNYDHPKLDEEWDFHVDNSFATSVVSQIQGSASLQLPNLNGSTKLCNACSGFDFFGSFGFSVEYSRDNLEKASQGCDLCGLFWRTYLRNKVIDVGSIRFERVQSSLRMNGMWTPVLSICRSLDFKTKVDIQVGLPSLPPGGSETHFEVIRRWLELCNDKNVHPNCHSTRSPAACLPKRLIYVGNKNDESVRLWETGPADTCEYIALSHRWGKEGRHFVTDISNFERHKQGIKVGDLPATFRDAVITTRALNKQHLWIDSICITQGPGGDFDAQASTMETVFSLAYCVISASRAIDHYDGFLQNSPDREYVTIRKSADEAPFYICENIDDFDKHVLKGDLNQRGWVLQEHALARRTIFFTKSQTYWECGDGVRCETLTKMTNNLAAFLGDPSFPRLIMSASHGEKIIRFQNLYKTYSSLNFSRETDRPIAMDGIQNKLLKAFKTRGGFGIFDEDETGQGGLLRRALLWHRAHGKELSKIVFDKKPVPSWSWMAYMGEIDYLKVEFGKIEWEKMQSPWMRNQTANTAISESNDSTALTGQIYTINPDTNMDGLGQVYFDLPEESKPSPLQCMVLGVEKGRRPPGYRTHYFILVAPSKTSKNGGGLHYERIGAGNLPGRLFMSERHEGSVW